MKVPKTSKLAYDSITLESKQSMWAKIIKVMRKNKTGLTNDEISKALKVDHVVIARRTPELVQAGIMYNTPVTRPTRTGRLAIVKMLRKKYQAA
jgi:predicted transcriptional regulator